MNRLDSRWTPTRPCDLQRVIEPLASFICATNQPRTALARALALLVNEVEQTNRVADARVLAFSAQSCS